MIKQSDYKKNKRPSDNTKRALQIIKVLRKSTQGMIKPMVCLIKERFGTDPFLILISCILSLRTRDTTTYPICVKLFDQVQTPQELLKLSTSYLEKLLFPIGFYRRKAQLLPTISKDIIDRFQGKVPSSLTELLSIKGVGKKTANLVLGEGFGIPAICVDTHVHRISNRLGLVSSKTPEETEQQLQQILPKKYWIEYNHLLVMWGQNICVPISPFCSQCAIFELCQRKGVRTSR